MTIEPAQVERGQTIRIYGDTRGHIHPIKYFLRTASGKLAPLDFDPVSEDGKWVGEAIVGCDWPLGEAVIVGAATGKDPLCPVEVYENTIQVEPETVAADFFIPPSNLQNKVLRQGEYIEIQWNDNDICGATIQFYFDPDTTSAEPWTGEQNAMPIAQIIDTASYINSVLLPTSELPAGSSYVVWAEIRWGESYARHLVSGAVSVIDFAPEDPPRERFAYQIQDTSAPNLVIVTHGWRGGGLFFSEEDWLGPTQGLAGAIERHLADRVASDWEVVFYNWSDGAGSGNILDATPRGAQEALNNAVLRGSYVANALVQRGGIEYVHLIGHSAGAGFVHAVSSRLAGTRDVDITVHATYLDPFFGLNFELVGNQRADYTEVYYAEPGRFFEEHHTQATVRGYNVNVTAPFEAGWAVYDSGGGHVYPVLFYRAGIDWMVSERWEAPGEEAGFWLSAAFDGDVEELIFARDNQADPVTLGPAPSGARSLDGHNRTLSDIVGVGTQIARQIDWEGDYIDGPLSGTIEVSEAGARLRTPAANTGIAAGEWVVDVPEAWTGLEIDYTWAGDRGIQDGQLRVFIDGEQVCTVDRSVGEESGMYVAPFGSAFLLDGRVSPGVRRITVRLDSYSSAGSEIVVADIRAVRHVQFDPDLNGDGVASIEDLHAAYQESPDLDGNGLADSRDLQMLERWLRKNEAADMRYGR